MKGDKTTDIPANRQNTKGGATSQQPSQGSDSPVVAEAGDNLMQFLQTGSSGPESPSTVSFETAANTASWILDLKVKVIDIHGKEWIGEVFTYDTLTNCLILKNESSSSNAQINNSGIPGSSKNYSFQIIKVNAIQTIAPLRAEDILTNEAKIKVSPIDHVMLSANPAPRHINLDALSAREQKILSEAQEKIRRMNPRAPGSGQKIFMALSKTLPCVWDKNDIIVLDEVRIKPLYKIETCEALLPTSQQTLERVKKVLSSERKKLSLDSSPVGTPPKQDSRSSSRKENSNKKSNGAPKKDFKPKDLQKK